MITLVALALALPSNFVAVDRLIIGQLKGKSWTPIDLASKSDQPIRLTSLKLNGVGAQITYKGFQPEEVAGGVYLKSDDFEEMVGTYGLKPAFPRKVQAIDLKSKSYVAALGAYLKSKGVKTSPRLTAAYRVDFDVDGTDEVLLEGSNPGMSEEKTMEFHAGDYSVLLLRSIKKGKVVTRVLFSNTNGNNGMCFTTLRSVVDLDGDGKMEIIASNDYYEGASAAIFGYKAGVLKKLIETGAGV